MSFMFLFNGKVNLCRVSAYFLHATKGIELITELCSESHRKLNKLFFTRDKFCLNCLQIYFV